jgi:hypothetical protein
MSKKLLLTVIAFYLLIGTTNAQTDISGYVRNSLGENIIDCTVLLLKKDDDSDFKISFPDTSGFFQFKEIFPNTSYSLVLQGISYYSDTTFLVTGSSTDISPPLSIILESRDSPLDTIYVTASMPKIIVNNDTIIFDASKFKGENDDRIVDVLENIPGITVNRQTGVIRFRNKPVETILINGTDVFRSDYNRAVKIISSDIVETVEVIKDYHPNHLEKGLFESQDVALNIKTQEGRRTINGEVTLLGGYKGKYSGLNAIAISSSNTSFIDLNYNDLSRSEDYYDLTEAEYKDYNFTGYDPRFSHRLNIRPSAPRSYDNKLGRVKVQSSWNLNSTSEVNLQIQSSRESFFLLENRTNVFKSLDESSSPSIIQISSDSLNSHRNRFFSKIEFVLKGVKDELLKISTSGYFSNRQAQGVFSLNSRTLDNNLNNNNRTIETKLNYCKKLNTNYLFDVYGSFKTSSNKSIFASNGIFLENTPSIISFSEETKNNHTRTKFGSSLLAKLNTTTYKLEINSKRIFDKFNSFSEAFLVQESSYSLVVSDISFSRMQKIGHYNTNLFLSLHHYNQKKQTNISQSDLMPAGGINVRRQLSNKERISFASSWNQLSPNFLYLNSSKIYNSVNSLRVGSESITPIVNQADLSVSYNYNNLFSQNQVNIDLSYSHLSGTFISRTSVDSLVTVTNYEYLDNSLSTVNTNIKYSTLIDKLNSKLDIAIGYIQGVSYGNVNENEINAVLNNIYSANIALKSAFESWLNFRLYSDISVSTYNLSGIQRKQSNWNNNVQIILSPLKRLRIHIYNSHSSITSEEDTNQQYFLDVKILYLPETSKMDFYFQGGNILGQKEFSQVTSSAILQSSITTNTYPSYFVIGGNYRL